MTTHWRTTTGWSDLPSLPFDYTKELVGARTPCLLGSESLIPAAARLGWRYDCSSSSRQVWPHQFPGTSMWNLSLSQIPFPGHSFEVLAMDYNYMANQSGPTPAKVATRYAEWKAQALGALLAGRNADSVAAADRAGRELGLAFQAADDLLDVEGATVVLGKTAGKDAAQDKATWVRLEGAAAARARTARLGRRGTLLLQELLPSGPESARLLDLIRLLWDRDR